MVIHHFIVQSHGEVGGDQAGSAFELPLAALDAPVDGPVLQAGVRACAKKTLAPVLNRRGPVRGGRPATLPGEFRWPK